MGQIGMEVIIQKSIDGGYENYGFESKNVLMYDDKILTANVEKCLLDPLFWRALGKSCGWNDESLWRAGIDGSAEWYLRAMSFHEINLTQGLEQAVKLLEELVTNNK